MPFIGVGLVSNDYVTPTPFAAFTKQGPTHPTHSDSPIPLCHNHGLLLTHTHAYVCAR